MKLGIALGKPLGTSLGMKLGLPLGSKLRAELGTPLGERLGLELGTALGERLGRELGAKLLLGCAVAVGGAFRLNAAFYMLTGLNFFDSQNNYNAE